jgi:hypothetical protein
MSRIRGSQLRDESVDGSKIEDDTITGDDINESTLKVTFITDLDADTKIQVEESADEDKIRFDVAGSEAVVIDGNIVDIKQAVIAKSYKDTVFTITDGSSVDIDPDNGGIQVWTLGANRSPTANNFDAGARVMLMINDGTNYSITWPSVNWVGGVAPTLPTSGYGIIELWKVGSQLYGAFAGGVA